MKSLAMAEIIARKIHLRRGQKAMLDRDLAELCGVEVKQLKRQERRNPGRVPDDFMFQLSKEEYDASRCHFGTLKRGKHTKYLPYVFAEEGVAMLRKMAVEHKDLAQRLDAMEQKHDGQFKVVFDATRLLIAEPAPKEKKTGFIREGQAACGVAGDVSV